MQDAASEGAYLSMKAGEVKRGLIRGTNSNLLNPNLAYRRYKVRSVNPEPPSGTKQDQQLYLADAAARGRYDSADRTSFAVQYAQ